MAELIAAIVSVAGTIYGLVDKFKKQRKARKKAIAEYYRRIANTLKHTTSMLRQNEVPHGDCQKILTYAHQLPDTIGDVVGLELANELSQQLDSAFEVEYLIVTLQDSPDKEGELAQLEKAAGYFDASADSLLASR